MKWTLFGPPDARNWQRYQCTRCGIVSGYTPDGLEAMKPHNCDGDASLIGNKIAQFTLSIGIPHCGTCDERQDLLNTAHLWLRRSLNGKK